MKKIMRSLGRKIILKILPDSNLLRYLSYRPMLETWRNTHSRNYPIFNERTELYNYINREIILNKAILYLEFGVYKGATIKYFANINADPNSKFIGFDTFTGLPENWVELSRTVNKKTFDTSGELPHTNDCRISFVKGLFQDTLPECLKEYKSNYVNEQLVIHVDCDLYSSALYVLTYLNHFLVPGTVIIFDEFYSVMHEFRALEDYCSAYIRSYQVISATKDHIQVAIKMQ